MSSSKIDQIHSPTSPAPLTPTIFASRPTDLTMADIMGNHTVPAPQRPGVANDKAPGNDAGGLCLVNSRPILGHEGLKGYKLVQQVEKSFHSIRDEYGRWRSILEVPYQKFVTTK